MASSILNTNNFQTDLFDLLMGHEQVLPFQTSLPGSNGSEGVLNIPQSSGIG